MLEFEKIEERKLCENSQSDFIKSSIISPDGYFCLLSSESNYITNWNIPPNTIYNHLYYPSSSSSSSHSSSDSKENNSINIQGVYNIGESIYDFIWYPHMNSTYLPSCCFITTSRDHPIHLWDMNEGTIKCSYLGYNHMDELDPAISLSFNITGDKIYSGSNRMIRCFDLSNPGRQYTSLPTAKSKKSSNGQKGLISCISFNPIHTEIFAAGSYDQSIYMYSENMKGKIDNFTSDEEFGVTCLKWSPCGNYLWAGGRKNSNLICYDIRSPKNEVGRVSRFLSTNQRMNFSIDPWGSSLVTGTEDGKIIIYDTTSFNEIYSTVVTKSCVNSVTFHPYSSLLIASSGERSFHLNNNDNNSDNSDNSDSENNLNWSELMIIKYKRDGFVPTIENIES